MNLPIDFCDGLLNATYAMVHNLLQTLPKLQASRRHYPHQTPVGSCEFVALARGFPSRKIGIARIELFPLPRVVFAAAHPRKKSPRLALLIHAFPVFAGGLLCHRTRMPHRPHQCQANVSPMLHQYTVREAQDLPRNTLDSPTQFATNQVSEPPAVWPLETAFSDFALGRSRRAARLYIIATSRTSQPIVPGFRNASASFFLGPRSGSFARTPTYSIVPRSEYRTVSACRRDARGFG